KSRPDYSQLNLEELLLVAKVEIKDQRGNNMLESNFSAIEARKTDRAKCIRCWNYRNLEEDIWQRCQKSTNVIGKIQDNFLNKLSIKYFFNKVLVLNGKKISLKEVENFQTTSTE
ncbi:18087_t:CDS:2, partial [Gigaspora rosea]